MQVMQCMLGFWNKQQMQNNHMPMAQMTNPDLWLQVFLPKKVGFCSELELQRAADFELRPRCKALWPMAWQWATAWDLPLDPFPTSGRATFRDFKGCKCKPSAETSMVPKSMPFRRLLGAKLGNLCSESDRNQSKRWVR